MHGFDLIGHNRSRESVRLTHTRSRYFEHRFLAYISVSAGRVARQHRVGFGGPDRNDLSGTDNWDADLFLWKKSSDPSRKVRPVILKGCYSSFLLTSDNQQWLQWQRLLLAPSTPTSSFAPNPTTATAT
ncbi:hypothetical protein HN51_042600 [Arachis hypogaea]